MLILSRELGESVVFEDVVLTLAKVGSRYVEVSLVKATGDKRTVVTLPHNEYVDICDDVRVIFINVNGTKVRLGFEAPDDVTFRRREFLET